MMAELKSRRTGNYKLGVYDLHQKYCILYLLYMRRILLYMHFKEAVIAYVYSLQYVCVNYRISMCLM
jgi:hypothetical protein